MKHYSTSLEITRPNEKIQEFVEVCRWLKCWDGITNQKSKEVDLLAMLHIVKGTNYCAVLEVRTSNKTLNYVMEQFY